MQSHASTSMHKSPKLAAIPLFGHMKILYTWIGMGSGVLVGAGKATERDEEVLINKLVQLTGAFGISHRCPAPAPPSGWE